MQMQAVGPLNKIHHGPARCSLLVVVSLKYGPSSAGPQGLGFIGLFRRTRCRQSIHIPKFLDRGFCESERALILKDGSKETISDDVSALSLLRRPRESDGREDVDGVMALAAWKVPFLQSKVPCKGLRQSLVV